MVKYKYGPLIYITEGMEDDEGNYYWGGSPPVGYDDSGIPVDKNGLQCLDIQCPLHPGWEPYEVEFNHVLSHRLPTLKHFRQWFDDNFLEITDYQIKKYILKWWFRRAPLDTPYYNEILKKYSSVEELLEAVWPQEEQTS